MLQRDYTLVTLMSQAIWSKIYFFLIISFRFLCYLYNLTHKMVKSRGSRPMKSSLLFQYALSRFLRFVVTAEILILTALCLSVFSRKLSSGAIFSSTQNATPSDSAQTEEKKVY